MTPESEERLKPKMSFVGRVVVCGRKKKNLTDKEGNGWVEERDGLFSPLGGWRG